MLSLDIQVEILKRLPVKSLIQFRSVCKAWKSLIESSHFIAGYNNHRQHLMIRYVDEYEEEDVVKYVSFVDDDDDDDSFPQQKFFPTVPFLVQSKATRIIGSSHGLVCLHCYSRKIPMAVLWNPIIRKSIAVALPDVPKMPFRYVIGFGVRPDTKDPIIVKITFILHINSMERISSIPRQVMVFSLSTGEWTCLCSNNLPRKSIQFSSSQTVIGQYIYWVVSNCSREADGFKYNNLIMSFDMTTGEFREVDLPDSLLYGSNLSISRLRESLVLLEYRINFTTKKRVCDVWMMEQGDVKVFTKFLTIEVPNASIAWTLGFRNNGQPIIEMKNDVGDDGAIVVYDPCSEHIKDLRIDGNVNSFEPRSYEYTESLLLLDHDDGHIVK